MERIPFLGAVVVRACSNKLSQQGFFFFGREAKEFVCGPGWGLLP